MELRPAQNAVNAARMPAGVIGLVLRVNDAAVDDGSGERDIVTLVVRVALRPRLTCAGGRTR